MTIKKIGIVGAGQMGNGIAHVFAGSNFHVKLYDNSPDVMAQVMDKIAYNMVRPLEHGGLDAASAKDALSRITLVDDLTDLADSDLIVETAAEDESDKKKIYAVLCPLLGSDAIIATNTSSISITRLAASTNRADKFIGMHFMNPVPRMELIELIRGIATEEDTFQKIYQVCEDLGKTSTTAEDFPAFIVNRVLMPMLNEAVYTLYEGVGTVEGIDLAMRLGANHPMGPLQLADFIGLDICLSNMQVLYEGLADTKYRPCPLLVRYVEAGWLGRKSGRGFYDYRGEGAPVPTR
jgi:3-hydroxybutyryl-CoA dehydrogenase